jgi:predicted small secreted protein
MKFSDYNYRSWGRYMMYTMCLRILVYFCLIAFLSVNLSGCNTVRGLGEDMKQAGKALQKVAKKTEKKIQDKNAD